MYVRIYDFGGSQNGTVHLYITSKTVFGMHCEAIIIFPVWNYQPKIKNGISAYGDGGTYDISVSIKRLFISVS